MCLFKRVTWAILVVHCPLVVINENYQGHFNWLSSIMIIVKYTGLFTTTPSETVSHKHPTENNYSTVDVLHLETTKITVHIDNLLTCDFSVIPDVRLM